MRHWYDVVGETVTTGDWLRGYSNATTSSEPYSTYTCVWQDDNRWHAESPTHTYGNLYYERFVDAWNKVNPNSWFTYDPINDAWKYVTPETQNAKIDPAELEELL